MIDMALLSDILCTMGATTGILLILGTIINYYNEHFKGIRHRKEESEENNYGNR